MVIKEQAEAKKRAEEADRKLRESDHAARYVCVIALCTTFKYLEPLYSN